MEPEAPSDEEVRHAPAGGVMRMDERWQVVPDEDDHQDDPHESRSVELRRIGGLAVVMLMVAASTASMLDQSSFAPLSVHAASRSCNPRGAATPTGSMILGRSGHTATRLRSGKVLVTGGRIDPIAARSSTPRNAVTASAELYDPTTGTWSVTGPMSSARTFHSAVLLPSGKVLVAGGRDFPRFDSVTSAELYDPDTGNWTETGDMRDARDSFAAIVLRSGKVLVTPGLAPDNATRAYEVYDPARGNWSAIGGSAVRFGSATLLESGRVLVIGRGSLDSAELYDPPSNTWRPAGTMITARYSYTSTGLPSGKVLVAGGHEPTESSGTTSSAEIYDPAGGTWTQTNSMTSPHSDANATLLPSGEVLVAGGWNRLVAGAVAGAVDSIDLYDPATEHWTALGIMAAPRAGFTATLLRSGALLFAGGFGPPDGDGFSASAEIYALTCSSH
jgi:Kelch motif protein/galactose oxidase-like protein